MLTLKPPRFPLPIEAVAHFLPASDVTRYQEVSHFLLDASPALLRRTGSKIPMTIRLVAMRPERVTQKTKAFFACCLDAGLRFVQSKAEPRHHTARPIQCLGRMPTAENHEVSSPGESHPEALAELYVSLSAHTAPIMEPRRAPICQ